MLYCLYELPETKNQINVQCSNVQLIDSRYIDSRMDILDKKISKKSHKSQDFAYLSQHYIHYV